MNKEVRSANFTFLIYSSLSVLLLVLSINPFITSARAVAGYVIFPFLAGADSFRSTITDILPNVSALINSAQENKLLRQKVADMRIELAELKSLREENARLNLSAGVISQSGFKGVWAKIIERSPQTWNSSVLVNRGSLDGVKKNAPILAVNDERIGLLGRVMEVYPHLSKALLLTDSMSSVSCYVKDTQWEGLIEGDNSEFLKLKYVSGSAEIAIGAEIITSPSGAVFPPGLAVGRVSKFLKKESFMTFISAELEPAVRQEKVKEVFILDTKADNGGSR
ncbi:MAG: rod shape-determining protein MreC [Elusimicrobia bacterium]|nr:rod shape-determining protein MreC [Elusimicrobiota bacterium]